MPGMSLPKSKKCLDLVSSTVRLPLVVLALFLFLGCESVKDVSQQPMAEQLVGRCLRLRQDVQLIAGRKTVSDCYLVSAGDSRTASGGEFQVLGNLPMGTELEIERVVVHSHFEDSRVVVISNIESRDHGRLDADLFWLFRALWLDDLRAVLNETMPEEGLPDLSASLNEDLAEWCLEKTPKAVSEGRIGAE